MQSSFRQRIFLSVFGLFTLFTVTVVLYIYDRERRYKAEQLEVTLDNISETTRLFIEHNQISERGNFHLIDSLITILPQKHVRLSVFNHKGLVLFDSFVSDVASMENHLSRPEVKEALTKGRGSAIRQSSTTHQKFYYYAKEYDNYFIRTAVVYDIEIVKYLKTEGQFLIFIFFLFIIAWGLLYLITRRLGEFITRLKDFAIKAQQNEEFDPNEKFPNDELGIIRKKIVQIYYNLNKSKNDLSNEKEKLFRHLQALNAGIAFFGPNREKTMANSHFIQYINHISERSSISAEHIFLVPEMKPISDFIQVNQGLEMLNPTQDLPKHEFIIQKNELFYQVQTILFADKSFEILITDITRPERRRILKQQLTSNIAHELKTPLSSIRGYLETVLNADNLPVEKQRYFVQKAYDQSNRMTHLVNDVALLNNIEDAGDLFKFSELSVSLVINDSLENLKAKLDEKQMSCEVHVQKEVKIQGNESLIFSVFQNLIENSIHYAGAGSIITINNYLADERFYYFSYSDTGIGIPEEHLPRIFERFYRVDQGRARETGGTGLGLAIVKNAIQLHKGDISVRNKPEGGVEFLFSLPRL